VNRLNAFARFWWQFVIGDDWLAALLVVSAIALTVILAHARIAAWWLLPPAVVLILYVSLRRETRS
jgi:hypothetical protein